jgi:hypothetical protein
MVTLAYIAAALKISNSAFSTHALFILIVSRDYFLIIINQMLFVMENCCVSLWGTNWIPKYYLDELRLQRVNYHFNTVNSQHLGV